MQGRRKLALVVVVGALMLAFSAMSAAAQSAPTPPAANQGWTCPMTGVAGGWGGMRGGMMGGAGWGMWAEDSVVAETLGMTPSEIATARQNGQSLAEIAAAKGVDKAALVNAILAQRETQLDELVAAGRMTQAQADAMLANMKTMVEAMVDRESVGPMGPRFGTPNGDGSFTPGQGYGRGQGRMSPYWQNQDQDGTQAPAPRSGPGMMGRFGSRA